MGGGGGKGRKIRTQEKLENKKDVLVVFAHTISSVIHGNKTNKSQTLLDTM